MLTQLGWPIPQHHCFVTRLTIFYKIIHGIAPLTLLSYFSQTQYPTRQHHRKHFIIPSNSPAAYQKSFYPRTIREWNNISIVINILTKYITTINNIMLTCTHAIQLSLHRRH